MMNIKVTPEELRSTANYLASTREEILTLVNNMDSEINKVAAEWSGMSSSRYMDDYNALLPKLKDDFPQVIEALYSRLNYAADTIEQADVDTANAIKMF